MILANVYKKAVAPSRIYPKDVTRLVSGHETLRPLDQAAGETAEPKTQYSVPEAADYIVTRLNEKNLTLPHDQPRLLAEHLAKGKNVFPRDLESVLTDMIKKFPCFDIYHCGTIISPEPANLERTVREISHKEMDSSNELKIWTLEIARYRLLTAQEEEYFGRMKDAWKDRDKKRQELIQKMNMGDLTARQKEPYDQDLLKTPIDLACGLSVSVPDSQTPQEKVAKTRYGGRERLVIRYKSQLTAINYFIRHNLRLVIRPAVDKAIKSGMDVMALVQGGNIGLMRAAYKFDYRRKTRFSTYAVNCIKQAIDRVVQDQASNIRIPVHVSELRNKILKHYGGSDAVSKIDPADIAKQMAVSIENVENAIRSRGNTVSLDMELGEGVTVEDLQAYREPGYDEIGIDDSIETFLNTLIDPKRAHLGIKKAVICLRYELAHHLTPSDISGLIDLGELHRKYGIKIGGGRHGTYTGKTPSGDIVKRHSSGFALTLEEIGGLVGVTRERIRQIEAKALKQLRHPSRIKKIEGLKDF